MLYDGHPAAEPGAIVCRVSPCFIRFGHFQILTARNELKCSGILLTSLLAPSSSILGLEDKERFSSWFDEVCQKTAHMIVHWMRVGFVHGVMNTDNMSIIERPSTTVHMGGSMISIPNDFNTTDAANRRYRYSQQPAIAQWNLMQLANAILPLIEDPNRSSNPYQDMQKPMRPPGRK